MGYCKMDELTKEVRSQTKYLAKNPSSANADGLHKLMQEVLPWLFWSWCFSHSWELACKDACTTYCVIQGNQ